MAADDEKPTPAADELKEPDVAVLPPLTGRIRYADDVESGSRPTGGVVRRGRDALQRRRSNDSMSIRSISRRRQVEPNVVIPIRYRTLSFNIEDARSQDLRKEKSVDKQAADYLEREWHRLSTDEVFRRLSTSPKQGLSQEQVQRRLKEWGPNKMSPPPSQWAWKTFMYFFGGFGSILFVASILVFIAWKPLGDPPAVANLALGIVLAAVFFIQAAFNFWQDWSSSRVMASITNMLPEQCLVLRDGQQREIEGSQLVPGDVLRLKMGNKVPADVRLFEVSPDAKFDRAVLTGESVPVRAAVDSTDDNYLETQCIGMAGTHCAAGDTWGVVVATGDKTVFGELAKLTSQPKTGLTNLEKEIYYFVACIVAIMLTMIIIVIIVWATWLRKDHHDWINVSLLIVDCVSVAVAFIPEGLPIAVTSSLTIVAGIMKRNQILCKSLKTVETLGSVSVICSDKTGTLTSNKMTVTQYMVGREVKTAAAAAEAVRRSQEASAPLISQGLRRLAFLGGVCNAGEFDPTDGNTLLADRRIMGDATDQAVLRFSAGLVDVGALRAQSPVEMKVPFNSKNKFMINVFKGDDSPSEPSEKVPSVIPAPSMLLTIKGAPDILLPRCGKFLAPDGTAKEMDAKERDFFEQTKDAWSRDARRVILLAEKSIDADPMKPSNTADFEDNVLAEAASGLTLVGMMGIVDPPRPEIPDVVRTLHRAGVKVFMVTGDAALTAQAIAAECGIITQRAEDVMDVRGLQSISLPSSETELADSNEKGTAGKRGGAKDKVRHVRFAGEPARSIVLTGGDMKLLEDEDWDNLATFDEVVFARTTPEQKLRIVRELQARDEVVGMTGDGVNDAPSLKAADIGIAMGSGSDIAIEAADMVLLDSFAAIIEAVKYGRVVFDNLKKTICYLLPAGSFSEFWPVMANVMFGLPQVLSSFLMIIICCFTDCAAAVAIAYEKPEADVLLLPPRNPKRDHLVNFKLILQAYGFIGILETVASFSMAFWYMERKGVPFSTQWFGFGQLPDGFTQDEYTQVLNTASSIYFVNLVVMQWFTLLAIRTRRLSVFQHPPFGLPNPLKTTATSNLYLFPAVAFAFVMAIFWLYVPAFHSKLGTAQVPAENWFLPMTFGIGILLLDEGRKYAARRWPKGVVARIAW